MTRTLSVPQREAIRALHNRPGVLSAGINGGTLSSLRRRGLVHKAPSVALMEAGERMHARLLESGDGPEALKARLSFGGRR